MSLFNYTAREREEINTVQRELNPNPPLVHPAQSLYSVQDIRFKGQGMKAQMPIPRGTCILEEDALFTVESVGERLNRPNVRLIRRMYDEKPEFQALFCPGNRPIAEGTFEVNSLRISDDRDARR